MLIDGTVSPGHGTAILGIIAGIGITIAVTMISGIHPIGRKIDEDNLHHLSRILLMLAMLAATTGLLVFLGGDPEHMEAERTLTILASVLVVLVLMVGQSVVPEHVSNGFLRRQAEARRSYISQALRNVGTTRSTRSSMILSGAGLTLVSIMPTAVVLVPGRQSPNLGHILGSTAIITSICTALVLIGIIGFTAQQLLLVVTTPALVVMYELTLLLSLWREPVDWRLTLAVWALTLLAWVVVIVRGLRRQGGLRSALLVLLRLTARLERSRSGRMPPSPDTPSRWRKLINELRYMTGRAVEDEKSR